MNKMSVLPLFTAIALTFVTGFPAKALANEDIFERPHVKVIGQASKWVVPDEVTVDLSVTSWGKTPEAAKENNDSKTAAILAEIKSLGVEDKHLQTARMHLTPYYDRGYSRKATPDGYEARKAIIVNVQKLELVDPLVMTALKAGVNSVGRIQLKSKRIQEHEDTVRLEALANAKSKAVAMAKALGGEIGVPLIISEIAGGGVSPQGRLLATSARASASMESGGGETFAAGRIKVNAKVFVTFELK